MTSTESKQIATVWPPTVSVVGHKRSLQGGILFIVEIPPANNTAASATASASATATASTTETATAAATKGKSKKTKASSSTSSAVESSAEVALAETSRRAPLSVGEYGFVSVGQISFVNDVLNEPDVTELKNFLEADKNLRRRVKSGPLSYLFTRFSEGDTKRRRGVQVFPHYLHVIEEKLAERFKVLEGLSCYDVYARKFDASVPCGGKVYQDTEDLYKKSAAVLLLFFGQPRNLYVTPRSGAKFTLNAPNTADAPVQFLTQHNSALLLRGELMLAETERELKLLDSRVQPEECWFITFRFCVAATASPSKRARSAKHDFSNHLNETADDDDGDDNE